MSNLKDRTVFITGGSRGIGRAIALRCARAGANIVVASKTSAPHPKLPGTIHTVAAEVEEAGARALAIQCDVRFEDSVQAAVDKTVETFGGLDVVVNNAGAIMLMDVATLPMKRFDLMHQVNVRGTYLCIKVALEHLKKSTHAKVLNLSPPISLDPKWLKGHCAYTMSKYGMTMCTIGLAEEFADDDIAVTSLWPRTTIATAAVNMLLGEQGMQNSRKPEIMADAAYEILNTAGCALSGQALLDEDFLRERGVTDFDPYLVSPDAVPMPDFYVEPKTFD